MIFNAISVVPAATLIVALGDWPYGYYQLLRLVVCACAVVIVALEYRKSTSVTGWIIAFSGMALLFNPFAPVHFEREIWQVLDLMAATIFLGHFAVSTIRR